MTTQPQSDSSRPDDIIVVADELDDSPQSGGSLRPYLELVRAPAVFTALADVLLGFFFAYRHLFHWGMAYLPPWGLLATLLGASALLYMAGMVLNDYFDAGVDARERPRRPIPSGRVSRAAAGRIGGLMLLGGVALGWLAIIQAGNFRPGIVATGLAAAVLLYDAWLKNTPAGPLGMGACRMLNVLLGMSAAAEAFEATHYVLAGGVGVYIVGVSLFARREAESSSPIVLAAAMAVMAAGIGLIAWFPSWADEAGLGLALPASKVALWQQFMLLLGLLILYRCLMAILNRGQPRYVQMAVAHCLRSLIVLDAFACLAVAGIIPAIAIFALLVPAFVLGRWLYST